MATTTPNRYPLGQAVKITGVFTDAAGDPVDPATVTITYRQRNPNGTWETPVANSSPDSTTVGTHSVTFTPAGTGRFFYETKGETPDVVDTGFFDVEASEVQ